MYNNICIIIGITIRNTRISRKNKVKNVQFSHLKNYTKNFKTDPNHQKYEMEFVLSLKINELYHFIKILENTENTVKILFQHSYTDNAPLSSITQFIFKHNI